ncbi:MAG: transposase [Anaerolineales bacterium]
MYKITTEDRNGQTPEIQQPLDELARQGARKMIAEALELEVEKYIQEMRDLRDEDGHAMVVRNGKSHHERTVNLGAGPVSFQTPRVNDRRPDHRFTSKILPPYMRRSPRLEEALPVLYLRGLSTGDFTEALKALLGPEAAGFSASTITRLLKRWQEDYEVWSNIADIRAMRVGHIRFVRSQIITDAQQIAVDTSQMGSQLINAVHLGGRNSRHIIGRIPVDGQLVAVDRIRTSENVRGGVRRNKCLEEEQEPEN